LNPAQLIYHSKWIHEEQIDIVGGICRNFSASKPEENWYQFRLVYKIT
jgi:hypothetical protein